jgi:hypothetical protein
MRRALAPARYVRQCFAVHGEPDARADDERDGVDDYFGLFARVALIVDAERVRGLMDEGAQLPIGGQTLVHDDSLGLAIAPATRALGGLLERDHVAERAREVRGGSEQVRVGVTAKRLARRLERSLLSVLDRRDLCSIEHRDGTEQDALLAAVIAGERIAVLERHRREDPDRALSLANAIPELKPRLEPCNEARLWLREQDQAQIRDGVARETIARPRAHPLLPALGAEELLDRVLEPLALARTALLPIGF